MSPSQRGRQIAGIEESQTVIPSGGGWNTCYVCGKVIAGRGYDDQGKGRRHADCEMDPSVTNTVKVYIASTQGGS